MKEFIRKIKNTLHLFEAVVANLWFGFPSRELTIIGVTGTDGKTTTTSLIYHILKQSGIKVAMITTVGAFIDDQVYDIGFHVTTPSAFSIQRYLRKAVQSKLTHVVLETTSHALDQNRPWGIQFTIGVVTNITHEHLDYHQTYDRYVQAKVRLLKRSKLSIINQDDESYSHIMKYMNAYAVKTYSRKNYKAVYSPQNVPVTSTLVGEFNQYNILAASAVALELGISLKAITNALQTFSLPPGRQEIIPHKHLLIMIDFAHTPHAFKNILSTVRHKTKGRLIHMFGCAGERDTSKRKIMGAISAQFADIIVLTAEDPRSESVEHINAIIAQGISSKFLRKEATYEPKKVEKHILFSIPDRKQAIAKVIELAQPGDTLLFTGKGHETSMNYGQGEEPWSEQETVRKFLSPIV